MAWSAIRSLLDKKVTLQRATRTRDSVGGPVETWADASTNKRASIWPVDASPDLARAFQRKDIAVSHVICLAEDISAKAGDRIYDTAETGVYYAVQDAQKFENFGVIGHPLYVIGAVKRTI